LITDGWKESRLEPALFHLHQQGELVGSLVTHVDDLEGGIKASLIDSAFAHTVTVFNFSKAVIKDFVFRGREVKQNEAGDVDVAMRNYALSMKPISIPRARRQQPASPLTESEIAQLLSGMGELGWIARQLRDDVQYQSGCVQRARGSECIADLVKLNQAIGEARKGADYRRRFPHQLVLKDCVCVILADSGHANGTPENDDIKRYRSVGGHFLLLANKEIMDDKKVHIAFMDSRSSMTKRVCGARWRQRLPTLPRRLKQQTG
jgi:hypothetical protein